jgi:hypothetical protein
MTSQDDGATRWERVAAWALAALLAACHVQHASRSRDAAVDQDANPSPSAAGRAGTTAPTAGRAGTPSRAAAGSGGTAPPDAGAPGSADSGTGITPGVTVEVPKGKTLGVQQQDGVCRLDATGNIECRRPTSDWKTWRMGPFRSFSIGVSYACGVHPDGAVDCWNFDADTNGICDSSQFNCQISLPASDLRFESIVCADHVSCGVTGQHALACWGNNTRGQATPPAGDDFIGLAGENLAFCALRQGGQVQCWGEFGLSQSIDWPGLVQQVVVGKLNQCALAQGEVKCGNSWDPTSVSHPLKGIAQLSMHATSLCALTRDGRAACSGAEQLSRNRVQAGPFREIDNDDTHACGLRADGAVECWGGAWGSPDHEACAIGAGAVTLDGMARMLPTQGSFVDYGRPGPQGWTLGSAIGVNGFAWLAGATLLPPSTQVGRYALPNVTPLPLVGSWWLLDATAQASGSVWCSPADSGSTVMRRGDELVFDAQQLSNLGSCPGRAVSGELSFCRGSGCGMSANFGSIHDTPWTSDYGSMANFTPELRFNDGSALIASLLPGDGFSLHWGVLFTSRTSPFAGETLCVGAASGQTNADSFRLVLSQLSTLGTCPTGSARLNGCVR